MNEEALQNIWQRLTDDGLTQSDFQSWLDNVNSDEKIKQNVFNYLSKNKLTDNDYETWNENTGLKKKDPTDVSSSVLEATQQMGTEVSTLDSEPSEFSSEQEEDSFFNYPDLLPKQEPLSQTEQLDEQIASDFGMDDLALVSESTSANIQSPFDFSQPAEQDLFSYEKDWQFQVGEQPEDVQQIEQAQYDYFSKHNMGKGMEEVKGVLDKIRYHYEVLNDPDQYLERVITEDDEYSELEREASIKLHREQALKLQQEYVELQEEESFKNTLYGWNTFVYDHIKNKFPNQSEDFWIQQAMLNNINPYHIRRDAITIDGENVAYDEAQDWMLNSENADRLIENPDLVQFSGNYDDEAFQALKNLKEDQISSGTSRTWDVVESLYARGVEIAGGLMELNAMVNPETILRREGFNSIAHFLGNEDVPYKSAYAKMMEEGDPAAKALVEYSRDFTDRKVRKYKYGISESIVNDNWGDAWYQMSNMFGSAGADLALMFGAGAGGLAISSGSIFGTEALEVKEHNKGLDPEDRVSWAGIYANAGITAGIVYATDKFTLGNMKATRKLFTEALQTRAPKMFGTPKMKAPEVPIGESWWRGVTKNPLVDIPVSGLRESYTETLQEVGSMVTDYYTGMYDVDTDDDGIRERPTFSEFKNENIMSYNMMDVFIGSFLPGAGPKFAGHSVKYFVNEYIKIQQDAQFTVEDVATGDTKTMSRPQFINHISDEDNKKKFKNGEESWKAVNANDLKVRVEMLLTDFNSPENETKRKEMIGYENDIFSLGRKLEKAVDEGASDEDVDAIIQEISETRAKLIDLNNNNDAVGVSSQGRKYINEFDEYIKDKGITLDSKLDSRLTNKKDVNISKETKNGEITSDQQYNSVKAQVNKGLKRPNVVIKEGKQGIKKKNKTTSKGDVELNTFTSLENAKKALKSYIAKKGQENKDKQKQIKSNNVKTFIESDINDLDQMSEGEFKALMESGDYHIVSAEKSSLKEEENKNRVKILEERLKKDKGIKYKKVMGSSNGKSEVSFLVEGLSNSQALNLGELVGQTSVVSGKSGLIHSDNSSQANEGGPIIDYDIESEKDAKNSEALNQEGSTVINVDGKKVALSHRVNDNRKYSNDFDNSNTEDFKDHVVNRVPPGKAKYLMSAIKFINSIKGLSFKFYENSEAVARDIIQSKFKKQKININVADIPTKDLNKYLTPEELDETKSRGFFVNDDGTVSINVANVSKNTLFHELGHPVHEFLKKHDPELYNSINKELNGKSRWVMNKKTGLPTKESYYGWAKRVYERRAKAYAADLLKKKLITKDQVDEVVEEYYYGEAFSEYLGDASAQKIAPEKARGFLGFIQRLTTSEVRTDTENLNLADLSNLKDVVDNLSDAFVTGQKITYGDTEFEVNESREQRADKTTVKAQAVSDAENGTLEFGQEVASGPITIESDALSDRGPSRLSIDEDAINRHIDIDQVDVIDPSELDGQEVFVSAIDKSITAIITSPTGVSHEMMGGVLYSMQDGAGIWAFTTKKAAQDFIDNLKKRGVSRVVLMSQADTGILGNMNFNDYFVKEIENSIEKGNITEEEFLATVNDKLNRAGNAGVRKRLESVPTDRSIKVGNTNPPVSVPILSIEHYKEMLSKLGTVQRNAWNKFFIEGNATFLDKSGIPRLEEMYNYVNEPMLKGSKNGDLVATLEIDLNSEIAQTKEGDTGHHPGYPFMVHGRGLKVFNKFVDVRDAFPKFKVKEGDKSLGEKKKSDAARSMALTTQSADIKTKRLSMIGSSANLSHKMEDNFLLALHLEELGKGVDEIRKVTMWEKGPDGFWRYEIADGDFKPDWEVLIEDIVEELNSKMEPESDNFDKKTVDDYFSRKEIDSEILEKKQTEFWVDGERVRVKDIITDDVLIAYPDLANSEINFVIQRGETKAFYSPVDKSITLYVQDNSSVGELFSSLKHEIQHWIQDKEGFPFGGSDRYFENLSDKDYVWDGLFSRFDFKQKLELTNIRDGINKQRISDLKIVNSTKLFLDASEDYNLISSVSGNFIDGLREMSLYDFLTSTDVNHVVRLVVLDIAKRIPSTNKAEAIKEALRLYKEDPSATPYSLFEKIDKRQKRFKRFFNSKVETSDNLVGQSGKDLLSIMGHLESGELTVFDEVDIDGRSYQGDRKHWAIDRMAIRAKQLESRFTEAYSPFVLYQKVSGEVMARVAAKRSKYDSEQRLAESIEQTAMSLRNNFASEERIIIFGSAKSIEENKTYPDRLKQKLEDAREAGRVPRLQLTEDSDTFDNVLSNLNMTQKEVKSWRKKNKKKKRQRVPSDIIKQYANQEITFEEYTEQLKDKFPFMFGESTSVPEFTSFDVIAKALKGTQVAKGLIGFNKNIPDGTRVGSRLDINANGDFGVLCNSIHTGDAKGTIIGYGPFSLLTNVTFRTSPSTALKIGLGAESKSPFARMEGDWNNATEVEAKAIAEEMLQRYKDGDQSIVQVAMNPAMASYFFDRKTGLPLGNADRLVQIGGFILAENAELISPSDPKFMVESSDTPSIKRYQDVEGDYNRIESEEFRSNVFEAALNATDQPRQANQWVKLIEKFPGGQLELNYIDLKNILEEFQKDNNLKNITRKQVLSIIAANLTRPAIASVVRGKDTKYTHDDFYIDGDEVYIEGTDTRVGMIPEGMYDNIDDFTQEELIDAAITEEFTGGYRSTQGFYGIHILNETTDHEFGTTKWDNMVLSGGKNYREIIIRDTDDQMREPSNAHWSHLSEDEGAGTNVIVHLRTDDRVVNGKKILFIQEIQSDWAQRGTEKLDPDTGRKVADDEGDFVRRGFLTPERKVEREKLNAEANAEAEVIFDKLLAIRNGLHSEAFSDPALQQRVDLISEQSVLSTEGTFSDLALKLDNIPSRREKGILDESYLSDFEISILNNFTNEEIIKLGQFYVLEDGLNQALNDRNAINSASAIASIRNRIIDSRRLEIMPTEYLQEIIKLGKNVSEIENKIRQVMLIDEAVVDMPWAKTQRWLGLGFRKAISIAMKEGYDGVAIVNGEMAKKIEGHPDNRLDNFYNNIAPKELVKQFRRLDGNITSDLIAEVDLTSQETTNDIRDRVVQTLDVEASMVLGPMGVSESDAIDYNQDRRLYFIAEFIDPVIGRDFYGTYESKSRVEVSQDLEKLLTKYKERHTAIREEWGNLKAGSPESDKLFKDLTESKVEAAMVQYFYNQFKGYSDLGSALSVELSPESKEGWGNTHGLTRLQSAEDNDSEFLGFSSPVLDILFTIRKGALRADYNLGQWLTKDLQRRAGFTSEVKGQKAESNPLKIRATEFLFRPENTFGDPELTDKFASMQGRVAVAMAKAKRKAAIFKMAFDASKKGWTAKQLTDYLRGYEEIRNEDGEVIRRELDRNDLDEDITISLRGKSTTVNLRDLLIEMREDIDNLSQEGLDSGAFDGNMAMSVKENLGIYLHRDYKKHTMEIYNISEENVNRSKDIIRQKILKRTKLDPVKDADQIEKLVDTRFTEIFGSKSNYGLGENSLTPSQAGIVRDIFKRRQDIPMEIREIMGEIHDPLVSYLETISSLNKTISTHSMLEQMQDMGEGRFWSSETIEGKIVSNGLTKRLGSRFGVFEGHYVSDEVYGVLNNVYQDMRNTSGWAKSIYGMTLVTKWMKTVGNIPTHARNIIGNVAFVIQSGHVPLSPERMKLAWVSFKTVINNFRYMPEGKKQEVYNYLKGKGILSSDTEVGLVEDIYKDFEKSDFDLSINTQLKTNRVVSALKGVYNSMNKMYQSEDEVYKIYGFLVEQARYKKAGLSDLEAKEKAASIIMNVYPNYGKIPNIVRKVGKIPFFGTFVAFQSESLRVSYNSALLAKEEMTSENPDIRKIGAERAAGVIINNLVMDAAYSALAVLGLGYFAGEDEEEDAETGLKLAEKSPSKWFRTVVPHYNKTGNVSIQARGWLSGPDSKSFDGQLNNDAYVDFFDSSKIDGTGFHKNMMRIMFGDVPIEEESSKWKELYQEFTGPFLGIDITADAASDAWNLYNDLIRKGYTEAQAGKEAMNFLGSEMIPSMFKNLTIALDMESSIEELTIGYMRMEESDIPEEQATLRLMGLTQQRVNVNKALYFGAKARYSKLQYEMEKLGIRYTDLDNAEIIGILGSNEELASRMNDLMNFTTACQHWGNLHQQDIDAVFSAIGMTKYTQDYVMYNRHSYNLLK